MSSLSLSLSLVTLFELTVLYKPSILIFDPLHNPELIPIVNRTVQMCAKKLSSPIFCCTVTVSIPNWFTHHGLPVDCWKYCTGHNICGTQISQISVIEFTKSKFENLNENMYSQSGGHVTVTVLGCSLHMDGCVY